LDIGTPIRIDLSFYLSGASFINTEEKILAAAVKLMGERGFKSVAIKDIAEESGFSEMTVFRHFKTKVGVLEAAINTHSYVLPMKKLFSERIVWDLAEDLSLISFEYQKLMQKNKSIFLIALEERNSMPHLLKQFKERPRELKKYLMEYFREMQQRCKMLDVEIESVAVAFIHMNFGQFLSTLIESDYMININDEDFIKQAVQIFVRGLENQH
jgi:TetR/AcrR family transcriptional regulator, mexJK operon transcriptional repressor